MHDLFLSSLHYIDAAADLGSRSQFEFCTLVAFAFKFCVKCVKC